MSDSIYDVWEICALNAQLRKIVLKELYSLLRDNIITDTVSMLTKNGKEVIASTFQILDTYMFLK